MPGGGEGGELGTLIVILMLAVILGRLVIGSAWIVPYSFV
jgi:hypothetical protein